MSLQPVSKEKLFLEYKRLVTDYMSCFLTAGCFKTQTHCVEIVRLGRWGFRNIGIPKGEAHFAHSNADNGEITAFSLAICFVFDCVYRYICDAV